MTQPAAHPSDAPLDLDALLDAFWVAARVGTPDEQQQARAALVAAVRQGVKK